LEAREVMYAYASSGKRHYPSLTVYGKAIDEYDMAQLAGEAVLQVGSEIVSFVASAWRQSDRDAVAASFNPVLCIGGGVYYFYDYLKKRIPHLTRPDDPIHANALGYSNLAGRLLMRKAQSQTQTPNQTFGIKA
jgi:plasmid segregation protein ParM